MGTYLILFTVGLQPFVSLYPDTFFLVRIDLAPAIVAPPTRCVPLALGTLRHRTEVSDIGQGAIATIHAAEDRYLGQMFEVAETPPHSPRGVYSRGDVLKRPENKALRIEKEFVCQS